MPKKKGKRFEVIPPVPAVEFAESEAFIMTFDAPLSGSIVILGDVMCNECQRAGILVVSVHCRSCGVPVGRIMCLRSSVQVSHGSVLIPDSVVMCAQCEERDGDTAPPVVGGPLMKFNPNRLN